MKKIFYTIIILLFSIGLFSQIGTGPDNYVKSYMGCVTDGAPIGSPNPDFGCVEVWDSTNNNNYIWRLGTWQLQAGGGGVSYWTLTGSDIANNNAGEVTIDSVLNVETIQLDIASTTKANGEGSVGWNDEDKTMEIGMAGGTVKGQVMMEFLERVYNNSGADILNGYVVRVSGEQGTSATIALADASSIATAGVAGLATEDIANNSYGYIVKGGKLRDYNTFGNTTPTLYWLSETPGLPTTVKPVAPAIGVIIGYSEYEHATEGILSIDIANVPRLVGLSDVDATGRLDDYKIYWDAGTNTYKHKELTIVDITDLTFGIADGNALEVDGLPTLSDYAKFTANGLEGRSYLEVKTDLSLENVENTALSTWVGSTNLTTLGTISTGTWQGTPISDGYFDKTGDWTGTFDGQQGSYYLDFNNLTNKNEITTDISAGLSYDKAGLTIVDDAGLKLDVENILTGDMTFQVDQDLVVLDCTTGTGVGGKARVSLTTGSDANNPATNFIYITESGGLAVLNASTTLPTGAFAWIGMIVVPDAVTWATTGAYVFQRFTESINDSRGQLSHEREKLRVLGAVYYQGVSQTTNITTNVGVPDNVHLATGAGSVYQLHRQTFPAFTTGPYYYGNGTNQYSQITDLNAALSTSLGVSMSGDDFNLVIWGAVNFSSGECKLFVNLPNDSYNLAANAKSDRDNTADYSVPDDMRGVAFMIARVALSHSTSSGGTWSELETYSILGTPVGVKSGGAGAVASNEFDDSQFRIYDNLDPTKEIQFQVAPLTTSIIRTITMTDSDVDLSDIGLNSIHGSSDGSDHTFIDQDITSGSSPTLDGNNFTGIDANDVDISDAGALITATDVEGALQENRTAIDLNTAKETNVTTDLSITSVTPITLDVASSDGTDATIPAATTDDAGLMTAAKFDEIVVNNAKTTNVTTNLSLGTVSATTVDVNSSDGTNATLVEANTTQAGLLGSDKWDEIVANSLKVTNATHTGEVTGSGALTVDKTVITNKTLVTALTGDHVLISDGSDADALKRVNVSDFLGGGALTAYKTADESKTEDIVRILDTDVQVELEANSVYSFNLQIIVQASTVPDFIMEFQIPTGTTGGYIWDWDDTDETLISFTTLQAIAGTTLITCGNFTGYIITTNAGTFGIKWAQITSDITTTTLKKGSRIELTKLN